MVEVRQRLQWLLSRLQAILTDADGQPAKSERMAAWLRALKDVAYDIEDVLDEFDYEELRREMEEGGSSSSSVAVGADVSSLPPLDQVRKFLSFLGAGSLGEVVAERIADIWRRLDEIMEDKKALDMLGELDGEEAEMESADDREVMETTFSVSDPEMLGRDRQKDEAMGFLLGSPMDDLSVLAIVGMGGLGKTMLALSAYNDGKVVDYFDRKIWVQVSFDFDVERLTKQIVQQVADPNLMLHEINNFDVLQVTLANTLRGNRFLIVFDDMWYEDDVIKNHNAWRALCAPLHSGSKGSKILVTTRSTQVLGITLPVKTVELEGLEFEDSWALFKKHALLDGHSERHPNLEDIGKGIVEKLNGVPLAVVAIGSLLRFKSKEYEWTSVLQSELWKLEQGGGGILPALRVSYEHLQPHLKPCFAYCSVFNKGRQFDKLELVQLWMALGYIRHHRRRQMEEVGNDYLNCLVNRSLIQLIDGKYIVHDLLHDLARSVLEHDYCIVATDQLHKVTVEDQCKYHLRVLNKRVDATELAKLHSFRRLRTCIFMFYHLFIFQIPSGLFINMTCLRVLDLSGGDIHVLSDCIGNLRHLRYLDLRRMHVRYLPESLCSLYMLQTLRLQGCEQLQMLPKDMCNLINLRYLEAKQELVSGIFQIGRLIHLQVIDVFSLSEGNGVRIEDLKDMNDLRGRLCIRNLQRIGSKEEASQAHLSSKRYINRLELEWAEDLDVNNSNSEVEEAVLDALVPPPRLKELTIKYYDGEKFPCWMELQFISGLESISLCCCRRWDALPPLLGLLPFLMKLEISHFPKLIELPPLPTTLTHLRLQGVGLTAVPALQELALLQELIVCNIQDLWELPPLPTTLRIFTVENLGLRSLPGFYGVHGGLAGSRPNNSTPLLYELKIAGCQSLRSLGGVLQERLPCLSKLSIEDCKEVVSWPEEEEFQATLLSLQELSIENCPKLMPLPKDGVLSPTLKRLTVCSSPSFPNSSFFLQLQNMKSLTRQGDIFVEKQFQDLASCSEEALRHMGQINWLIIQLIYRNDVEFPFISLVYDIQQIGRRRHLDFVSYRRVFLRIRRDSINDEDCNSLLSTCLHHHHLCSSLLSLCIDDMPYSTFLLPRGGTEEDLLTLNLPSLEELVIMRCGDLRRLPLVETMLCHVQCLKQLSIIGCPEMTLPSVEEALQFLPSLEKLVIIDCPQLSLPNPDDHADDSDNGTSTSSSSLPSLHTFATNEVGLLANRQFVCKHLPSLRELAIFRSDHSSFPVVKEECLKSLRTLSLIDCRNLQEFPPDFRSLVPSLEALCIKNCPRLRCMPEMGLPASLEILAIDRSPQLEEDDWSKVSHIRLILVDRSFAQGTYSDYQEMVAKGNAVLTPF